MQHPFAEFTAKRKNSRKERISLNYSFLTPSTRTGIYKSPPPTALSPQLHPLFPRLCLRNPSVVFRLDGTIWLIRSTAGGKVGSWPGQLPHPLPDLQYWVLRWWFIDHVGHPGVPAGLDL